MAIRAVKGDVRKAMMNYARAMEIVLTDEQVAAGLTDEDCDVRRAMEIVLTKEQVAAGLTDEDCDVRRAIIVRERR